MLQSHCLQKVWRVMSPSFVHSWWALGMCPCWFPSARFSASLLQQYEMIQEIRHCVQPKFDDVTMWSNVPNDAEEYEDERLMFVVKLKRPSSDAR